MIAELWAWWRLDCLPVAQRLGYRREAAALSVRHRRLRAHWADHLAHTRAALIESARACRTAPVAPKRAWIMGAGLLHDVPLTELLELFERIDLVDVTFSPAARAAARRYDGRVRCVMQDVSGMLAAPAREPLQAAPDMPPDAWCASVNLLSQLPLLPCSALLRQGLPEDEVERRGRAMQQAHVVALRGAAHACLIIEHAQTHVPKNAKNPPQTCLPDQLLLRGVPEQLAATGWTRGSCWHWSLNPAGETDLPEGRAMQAWSR